MFEDEILNQIFENMQNKIEENIQKEYHERIKKITTKNDEEKINIKMNIISELYYKQGFKDGIFFAIKNMKK